LLLIYCFQEEANEPDLKKPLMLHVTIIDPVAIRGLLPGHVEAFAFFLWLKGWKYCWKLVYNQK